MSDEQLQRRVLALVEQESRLLDERRYVEWLDLFTEDGFYWLPIEPDSDPRDRLSLICDDTLRRRERVYRLMNTPVHAQDPPSRTLHVVSHVRAARQDDGAITADSHQLIVELRAGPGDDRQRGIGQQQLLAGTCHYRLLEQADGSLRIALKKLVLLNRDTVFGNLQFIP